MPIIWAFLSVKTMIETIVWLTSFFGHNVSKKQVRHTMVSIIVFTDKNAHNMGILIGR